MRVVISGGGTAGHIYPGLALAQALKTREDSVEILFIGTFRGPEKDVVVKEGFNFEPISARSFKRKLSFDLLNTFFFLCAGFFQALKILFRFKPDMVVGMGGYASFPTMAAAIILRVPCLIHEQNVLPGLANRVLGRFVSKIAVSFPETEKFFPCGKVFLTGNPVREEIIRNLGSETKRKEALSYFNLELERKTLLIFGGSQGARRLNEAFLEAYDKFRNETGLQIILATGINQYEIFKERFEQIKNLSDKLLCQCFPYIERMNLAYAVSDLVLSRAGAITLAELTTSGIPAILVPYPYASGGHQEKNARYLEKQGAAKLLLDEDLNGESMLQAVSSLIYDEEALGKMRMNMLSIGKPDAAKELAKQVEKLARK